MFSVFPYHDTFDCASTTVFGKDKEYVDLSIKNESKSFGLLIDPSIDCGSIVEFGGPGDLQVKNTISTRYDDKVHRKKSKVFAGQSAEIAKHLLESIFCEIPGYTTFRTDDLKSAALKGIEERARALQGWGEIAKVGANRRWQICHDRENVKPDWEALLKDVVNNTDTTIKLGNEGKNWKFTNEVVCSFDKKAILGIAVRNHAKMSAETRRCLKEALKFAQDTLQIGQLPVYDISVPTAGNLPDWATHKDDDNPEKNWNLPIYLQKANE